MRACFKATVVVCGGLVLSGCILTDRNYPTNFTSSHLPYTDADGQISIPQMIVANTCAKLLPKYEASKGYSGVLDEATKCVTIPQQPFETRYAAAVALFYSVYRDDLVAGAEARNRVQDAITQMADKLCGDFKVELERADAASETSFGLLGAFTGSLGGLLTSATAARSLAATAGLSSGSQAVLNKTLFKQQSLKVIKSGINMNLRDLTVEFEDKRKKSLKGYSLETAIKDGIRYVDACNVSDGLSKVADQLAAGSNASGVQESLEARTVKSIDDLTDEEMVAMVAHDPAKPKLPKDPPTTSEAVLAQYKTAYKDEVLKKGNTMRLGQLQALLAWAKKEAGK